MDRDAAGTSGESALTSGGQAVTSGAPLVMRRRAMIGVVVAFAALQGSVNAVSRFADLRDAGSDVAGWMIAVDDASSFLSWLVCMVLIWRLVAGLRPPRVGWSGALLVHLAATVPVSLLHVVLMVLLREGAYALSGIDYDFVHGALWGELLYEYRKDAPSYVLLALAFAAIQWASAPRLPIAADEAPALVVQDGTTRHRIAPQTIDWAEAAGNYVAIHWQGRQLLHRATLARLEQQLGPGFARIHRSRLVRRAAISAIETLSSGDFTVTLDNGDTLRGSRRYRGALA